jgi:KipI family sensor histidine kinase inhibitor
MADAGVGIDRGVGAHVDGATIETYGDAALLISAEAFSPADGPGWAQAVAGAIDAERPARFGIGRAIPAQASVVVPFDPLVIELSDAVEIARLALADVARRDADPGPGTGAHPAATPADPIEIPVRYGGVDGPDLDDVAALLGLRPTDVAELHASVVYRVLYLGFAPGFGYLGGLPPTLVVPRRTSPRENVPSGSVAIAGEQTAVYPLAMPGGWQLIGRTGTVLFDPERSAPALLSPGATVRFVPEARR